MNGDFHYYATYCAAYIAGFSHEDCLKICYSANLTDHFSKTFLKKIGAPLSAATTQLSMEMADARVDAIGIQDITRIWSSFHFLPYDLYAEVKKGSRLYKHKYRLICNTNSDLLVETVNLAKGAGLQSYGIAMHVLADTWAHRYFAGTPSLVINNVGGDICELIPDGDSFTEKKISFGHNPTKSDDIYTGKYTSSLFRLSESTIMSLGHGRAGHLPDYSFMRYKYMPAWKDYDEVIKDNPHDYMYAFCQMVYALKVLKGMIPGFEKERYDTEAVKPWEGRIRGILEKRQPDAGSDWKQLGYDMSGMDIEDFDLNRYTEEYISAPDDEKDNTFLGAYIIGALAQKSMVTNKIYKSGNRLAGISIDYSENGLKGIRDYFKLLNTINKRKTDDESSEDF